MLFVACLALGFIRGLLQNNEQGKKGEDIMTTIHVKIPNWLDLIFAWPAIVYRRWKYGEAFRRIYLDEGLWAIVDTADYYRFARFKWCLAGGKGKFYAARCQRIGPDDLKMVNLHREITNAPDGLLVDHRNNDGLDNRRDNLRWRHTHRIISTAEGTNPTPSLDLSVLLLINEECYGPRESTSTENVYISAASTPKSKPPVLMIKLLSNTIRNSPA